VFEFDRYHRRQEALEKRTRIREDEVLAHFQLHNPEPVYRDVDAGDMFGKLEATEAKLEIVWRGRELVNTKREGGVEVKGDYVIPPDKAIVEERALEKIKERKSHKRMEPSLLKRTQSNQSIDSIPRDRKSMDPSLFKRNRGDEGPRAIRNRRASSHSTSGSTRDRRSVRDRMRSIDAAEVVVAEKKKERPAPRRRGTPSPPPKRQRGVVEEKAPTLIINTTTKTISSRADGCVAKRRSRSDDVAEIDIPVSKDSRSNRMEKRSSAATDREVNGMLSFAKGALGDAEVKGGDLERSEEWKRFYKNWRRNLTRKR
jgi:hypothetical protein